MRWCSMRLCAQLVSLYLVIGVAPAAAESVADFYKERTITFLVGFGPGGGYDVSGRLLVRHLGRHIPGNPSIIVKNMPGAASMLMTNYLYNVAPRDGTVIGMPARNLVIEPLLGNPQARFDSTRFSWLGSMTREVSLCFTWSKSGISTLDDAKKREVLVGATGKFSDSYLYPLLLNSVFGTRFKPIVGYQDAPAIGIAMERGELDGMCSFTYSSIQSARPRWISDGLINILAQLTINPLKELPQARSVMEMTDDPSAKQAFELVFSNQEMGRPIAGPPGLPADRLAALRTAFDKTMTDPQFQEDAARNHIDISSIDGSAVDQLVGRIHAMPKKAIERILAIRPQ
jgi:tripartite-type tricarboxylate transporter receptor subunit TctC